MGLRKEKSRTLRRVMVRTVSGTVLHYRKKKNKSVRCPIYGTKLQGVPRSSNVQLHRLPKTKRRPERPYGGVLSSRAMRELIVRKARSQ